MSLHGGSDLKDQNDQLVGTNVKEQFEGEMEDEVIKDIAHEFTILEQIGGPTELADIVSYLLINPENTERLVMKLEKHRRPENIHKLKIKKCSPEIWSHTLHSIRAQYFISKYQQKT